MRHTHQPANAPAAWRSAAPPATNATPTTVAPAVPALFSEQAATRARADRLIRPRPFRIGAALRAANIVVCAVGIVVHLTAVAERRADARPRYRAATSFLPHTAAAAPLPGHRIGKLAFTPDGRAVYAVGTHTHARTLETNTEITAWDLATGKQLRHHVDTAAVDADTFALAPDGRRYALSGPTGITVVDERGVRFRLEGWPARGLHFSPDGRTLAAALRDGGLALIDTDPAASGFMRHLAATTSVEWARFLPGGKQLAVAARTSPLGEPGPELVRLAVWDAETGERLRHLGPATSPGLAALSPDGALVALTTPATGRTTVRRVSTGATLFDGVPPTTLYQYGRPVAWERVAFDRDRLRMDGADGTRVTWDWRGGTRGRYTATPGAAAPDLRPWWTGPAMSPDGRSGIRVEYDGDSDRIHALFRTRPDGAIVGPLEGWPGERP